MRDLKAIEAMRSDAKRIVEAIIDDLTDRSGLKQEWWGIDREIQEEIKQKWIEIVMSGGQ
jgi:hypothetical protein